MEREHVAELAGAEIRMLLVRQWPSNLLLTLVLRLITPLDRVWTREILPKVSPWGGVVMLLLFVCIILSTECLLARQEFLRRVHVRSGSLRME